MQGDHLFSPLDARSKMWVAAQGIPGLFYAPEALSKSERDKLLAMFWKWTSQMTCAPMDKDLVALLNGRQIYGSGLLLCLLR